MARVATIFFFLGAAVSCAASLDATTADATPANAVPRPTTSHRDDPSTAPPKKSIAAVPGESRAVVADLAGDTFDTAIPIGSLPYVATGNTCLFGDDAGAECGLDLPGGRDVIYRWTPEFDTLVDITLCNSGFDTKLYVWEDTAGNVVACNDDACGTNGERSRIMSLSMKGGTSYFIVVDGFAGLSCGYYELSLDANVSCEVSCGAFDQHENEPMCGGGYLDVSNPGCNALGTPIFTNLECNSPAAVCGTYGGYLDGEVAYRDTDWFTFDVNDPGTATICFSGELDSIVGIIDSETGCPVTDFLNFAVAPACETTCFSTSLPEGMWWIFVAPARFGPLAGACGSEYRFVISGAGCVVPTIIDEKSWGLVKSLYR